MQTKINIALGAALVAVIIAIVPLLAMFQPKSQDQGGGSRFPNGLSADSTAPSAGQVRGATLTLTGAATLGGTLTVTTTNAATSTTAVGCIQSTATSTATPVRLTFSPFAGTTTTQGGTSNFLVAAQYGSCPI